MQGDEGNSMYGRWIEEKEKTLTFCPPSWERVTAQGRKRKKKAGEP